MLTVVFKINNRQRKSPDQTGYIQKQKKRICIPNQVNFKILLKPKNIHNNNNIYKLNEQIYGAVESSSCILCDLARLFPVMFVCETCALAAWYSSEYS